MLSNCANADFDSSADYPNSSTLLEFDSFDIVYKVFSLSSDLGCKNASISFNNIFLSFFSSEAGILSS